MQKANENNTIQISDLGSHVSGRISDNIDRQTSAILGTAVASRIHSIVFFIGLLVRCGPIWVVALVANITGVTKAQFFSGFNFPPREHSQQWLFNIPFIDVTRDQSAVWIARMVL
jgi:hypothetical protein